MTRHLKELKEKITACKKCPRLRSYCREIAKTKRKAYQAETYWGKPVPGFGDPEAKLLIVGLAPGAHGANRTGRIFTGDQSGKWLYRAIHRFGFSNQPSWERANDGLVLNQTWITCVAKCAPPDNKPTKEELLNCHDYFINEWNYLKNISVIITLGQIAYTEVCKTALNQFSGSQNEKKEALKPPRFQHGVTWVTPCNKTIIGSYHPSQQNTFTGKLTEPMFDLVFKKAKSLLTNES